MPRTPWRRRRTTDSPRPAGRWTGRLRRGGSLARRVLVIRHRRDPSRSAAVAVADSSEAPLESHPDLVHLDVDALAPVSPAVRAPAGGPPAGPLTVPLLPGEHTIARRIRFAVVNLATLASLTLGLIAIFLAMRGEVRAAALCLIACVACDGLDGARAPPGGGARAGLK
ncbi:MAG: CDP-alcohol phosphatidyltransferase, partial [Dactylosporangium sp.]|nr:CDP-alcohol phosphatidyltransferase [Dactylosporangium sp.]